ncbi:MAG: glycerol-3-phosphate acyltransferase [Gaiellaceae bacterium]
MIAALCGYVLGLVPSADAVSRLTTGGTEPSTSTRPAAATRGEMNAFRILGRRSGLLVIGADIAKGILACAAGRAVVGDPGAHAAGVGAVLGHCYPIPSRFRGGKGIATSFGQCVATFPAFAPFDAATAILVTRLPGIRRPALASVAVSSSAWLLASIVWWRRGLPNLWGPRPTATLPLANAATIAVIASRALLLLRRQHADRPSESR